MTQNKPLAFVIMPFDSTLDAVYTDLIKSTLEPVGYLVQRADDLLTSRNILDDIVAKMAEAEIIVADLTDLNPNVFYELGLAHSINGRVVMLTQDISSLPFDLQSYRVLEYDTHFSRFNEARSRLEKIAVSALNKERVFGSPVSDFGRTRSGHESLKELNSVEEKTLDLDVAESEPGLLDHMLQMLESGAALTSIVEEITVATEKVGNQIEESSGQLNRTYEIEDLISQMRAKHAIVRQVGLHLNEYSRYLDDKNNKYASALAKFGTSFEAWLTLRPPENNEERSSLREQMDTLQAWEANISISRESTQQFAETILNTPRIESNSTKAMDSAYRQLMRLVGNLEQTEATIARAHRMISKLINEE